MTDKFYLKEVCGEYKFYEEKENLSTILEDKTKLMMDRINELGNNYEELEKENEQLKEENKELQEELNEFKEYVFSDEKILCYSCVNCISKGIYEVECSEKGKVDVHGTCFLYWKNEVK